MVGLADKHGRDRLEAACGKAVAAGDPSYRTIKGILVVGAETDPTPPTTGDGGAAAHLHGPTRLFGTVVDLATTNDATTNDATTNNDSSPRQMATTVLANHATKRCNEIPPAATTSADEYRYSPTAMPGPCPTHRGCVIARCHRFLCDWPIHILNQPGRPRRFCSPACRVAEHRRLR